MLFSLLLSIKTKEIDTAASWKAIWVRNNCLSCWNLETVVHDYQPKESALEQNHFSQMTAFSGDDSSSGEAGIPDSVPGSPWTEQREMDHKAYSTPFP